MSLRNVTLDANAVGGCFDDRLPHLLFDLRHFPRLGKDESPSSVDMQSSGAVTGFASDHEQVFLGASDETLRLAEPRHVTLDTRGVGAVVLRHVSERLSVFAFRPRVGLRAMANKTLISAGIRLLGKRRGRLLRRDVGFRLPSTAASASDFSGAFDGASGCSPNADTTMLETRHRMAIAVAVSVAGERRFNTAAILKFRARLKTVAVRQLVSNAVGASETVPDAAIQHNC